MLAASVLVAPVAAADEPARAPESVLRLAGCWNGAGEVMGTPVAVSVDARPTALGAMLALDANSVATADPTDRYAAHLVFGGSKDAGQVTGFWSDSFGGGMTATGSGTDQPGGFDIGYRYSDAEYVNRWRLSGDDLAWTIVARDSGGEEAPFAGYLLTRVTCRDASAG